MPRRGEHKTHCPKGHPYTPANTFVEKSTGAHRCRTCMRKQRRLGEPTGADINRQKTHCPKGHPYSGKNLIRRRGGGRHCRECQNAARRTGRPSTAQRNATKTHCPKGHPYSGDNLSVDDRGYRRCLACQREYMKGYNREHSRINLLKKYDHTPESFDAQLAEQGHRCAICRRPFTERRPPQVDHNHKTRKRRGLLCRDCNIGLGHFEDSPERLQAAIDYLARS